MDELTDLEILRRVLIRELETVNEYTALARRARDPAVRDLLMHIGEEEEEHIAECIQWMARLNPATGRYLARELGRVRGAGAPAGTVGGVIPVRPESDASRPPAMPAAPASSSTPATGAGARHPPEGGGGSRPAPAPGGGLLLSPAGLTVGSLLNLPMGTDG